MKSSDESFDAWLREQAQQSEYRPDAADWEAFEPLLPEKPRRRFIFWWMVPLFIVIGGVVWTLMPSKVAQPTSQKSATEPIQSSSDMSKHDIVEPRESVSVKPDSSNIVTLLNFNLQKYYQEIFSQLRQRQGHTYQESESLPPMVAEFLKSNISHFQDTMNTNQNSVSESSMVLEKNDSQSVTVPEKADSSQLEQRKPKTHSGKSYRFFAGLDASYMLVSPYAVNDIKYIDINGAGGSLKMGIYINKNIYFGTGLQWNQIKAQLNQQTSETQITSKVVYYTGLKMDPGTGRITKVKYQNRIYDTLVNKTDRVTNERMQLIAVPLFVGYSLNYRKWSADIALGGLLNIRSQFSSEGIVLNAQPVCPRFSYAGTVSVLFGYELRKSLFAQVGYQYNQLIAVSEPKNFQSLQLGLKYILSKSKN